MKRSTRTMQLTPSRTAFTLISDFCLWPLLFAPPLARRHSHIASQRRLIFVGLQVKHNTGALQRNEHNSTMAQWTVIRMAIAKNRDIAELMTAGLHGERAMDAADQLRLEQMSAEHAWAAFHIWDRTQRAVFPKGTFELTCGPLLCGLLRTARGGDWWQSAKYAGFIPGFVLDVDAMLAKDNGASVAIASGK